MKGLQPATRYHVVTEYTLTIQRNVIAVIFPQRPLQGSAEILLCVHGLHMQVGKPQPAQGKNRQPGLGPGILEDASDSQYRGQRHLPENMDKGELSG